MWVQDQTDNKSQVVWVVICWKAGNFWQGSWSVNPLLVYVLFHGLTLAWGCRNFLLVFLLNHRQISNARLEFGWAEWLISKYPGERFPGPHSRGRQIRSRVTLAQDAKLDDPLCNICHSHLNGNFVETSSLNLIITFDRASFHQSVDKSLICQYYYHCYWLEKLAPNQNSRLFSRVSRQLHVSQNDVSFSCVCPVTTLSK